MRSYRDLCGIARALDVVGERWALLVVRELLHGPKRFADLHAGLPGTSQNVLTRRLRDLEAGGVLHRRRALPPASGLVYELTDHGRGLEPVLLALGRWGGALAPTHGSRDELSPDALAVALRTTFVAGALPDVRATIQLRLPADAFLLVVFDGRLDVVRGESVSDAALTGDVRAVQDLVFDGRDLGDAVASGDAEVEGDIALLARVLASFDDHRDRGPAARPRV